MAKKKLKTFDLDEELKSKLDKSRYSTVEDVLSKSSLQLMTALRLSAAETEDLILKLSKSCLPKYYTALEMFEKDKTNYIQFGDPGLDQIMGGGLKKGTLTEIAGPPGAGKTQMCFHLSLQCFKTKLSVNAVCYIDTEGAFRSERLVEMLESNADFEETIEEILSKLHVFKPTDIISLSEIFKSLEVFCIEKDVGLLIIDSIASLARKEFSHNANIERSIVLASWAAQVKSLAEQLNVAVVVTNQVTTCSRISSTVNEMAEDQDGDVPKKIEVDCGESSSLQVCPALGNTWTHFVNTRLILQFAAESDINRQLIIAKSPVAPFATKDFSISSSGIIFVEETCYSYDCIDPNNHHIVVNPGLKML